MFPTATFVNHWAIVTGLFPETNGKGFGFKFNSHFVQWLNHPLITKVSLLTLFSVKHTTNQFLCKEQRDSISNGGMLQSPSG